MEISGSHSAIAHLRATSSPTPSNGASQRADAVASSSAEVQKIALDKQQQQQQQQQQEIRNLASRDREVRQHEQAHAAAGGVHAGSPQYELTKGSNGVSYATGGHVNIDVSEVPGDAQATLEKMQTVQRAALAPAQPSAQDRSVASAASAKAAEARAELRSEDSESLANATQARESQSAESSANEPRANAQISAYQSAQSHQDDGRAAGARVNAYA